jgi:hypothetical protein
MPDIVGGLIGVAFLVLWIYCIYDVITTDDAIVRNLPKMAWLIIVIVIPDIGSLLWLGLGRPHHWVRRVHSSQPHRPGLASRAGADPLDDPSLESLSPIVRHREEQARLRMWEAQLQRREEELRRRLGDEGGT